MLSPNYLHSVDSTQLSHRVSLTEATRHSSISVDRLKKHKQARVFILLPESQTGVVSLSVNTKAPEALKTDVSVLH